MSMNRTPTETTADETKRIPDGMRPLLEEAERISPPPLLMQHAPGWHPTLDAKCGSLHLFETSLPTFGYEFTASLSWDTNGDPEPALDLYMENGTHWDFENTHEIRDMADRTDVLAAWLTDISHVAETITTALPDLPITR